MHEYCSRVINWKRLQCSYGYAIIVHGCYYCRRDNNNRTMHYHIIAIIIRYNGANETGHAYTYQQL